MRDTMLSTSDNPFNPFTQFDDWYRFDEDKGYHSCSYLARIMRSYDTQTEEEEREEKERAIDEILHFNLTGNYIKVVNDIGS